jgi:subtilase family serine protease
MPKRFWLIIVVVVLVCVGFPRRAHGQSLPDLILSQNFSGPAQVARAQNDTVEVIVKNVGGDTLVTAFDILVYLSVDAVIDVGDRTAGTEALSIPIAPNDSVRVRVPVKVPALLALGTYQWLSLVDASGSVTESDETNNLGVGNVVEVVSPPSDLFILTGPTGATEVNLNGNYTVTLDFQNQGAGPTQNAFEVALYLSADSLLDAPDLEVGRSIVSDKIFENATRTLQLSAVIPQSQPLGGYQWLAVLDVAGTEVESDEFNNIGLGNATQVVEKLADLILSSSPSGPNGVYRRGSYSVTTQVKNQGTADLPPSMCPHPELGCGC